MSMRSSTLGLIVAGALSACTGGIGPVGANGLDAAPCTIVEEGGTKLLKCPDGRSTSLVGETGAKGEVGAQGPQGLQGIQGETGAAGESVVVIELGVGDANCPNGGASVSVSGVTRYVCNGAKGDQGIQGLQGVQGLEAGSTS